MLYRCNTATTQGASLGELIPLAQQQLFLIRPEFFKAFLGTPFGSLGFQIRSLESKKIIFGPLKSEKIGSLESEKLDPNKSIPGTLHFP